jgi:tetratricopeptide (TPR) repeat protein
MGRLFPHTSLLILGAALCCSSLLSAQTLADHEAAKQQRHQDPQWDAVKGHLPDPAISSAKALETEADLLRARRFPEDALDYYNYALQRGGTTAPLLNKIGLVQLELRNQGLAEQFFRHAVKRDRHFSQAWNNLAVTEYMQQRYLAAVSDYRKAVALDKKNAIFHVNLGTAYFETKDYKNYRKQAAEALKLDPFVFQHGSGSGVTAHILSVQDHARFAYEMARLYAQSGEEEEMLHSLAKATEGGFDILTAMSKDPNLAKYRTDPRVTLLVMTAKALRPGGAAPVMSAAAMSAALPPADAIQR